MSFWSDCECTFLSSETHIQLYKVVHFCCFLSPLKRLLGWLVQIWGFLSQAASCSSGVRVVSVSGSDFIKRKHPRWNVPFLQLVLHFFPSTFLSPHLFLLLLDTAPPIPPISLYSPNRSTHSASTNPPSSSCCITSLLHFFDPKLNRSPGRPASQHLWHQVCRSLYQACVAGGARSYFYMKCACFLTQTIEQTH